MNTENVWTYFIIEEDCNIDVFYYAAGILITHLKVDFNNKLNDFDTIYWDFQFDNTVMTLHYNIYLGLSLFPTRLREASRADNVAVLQIGQVLKQLLTASIK